MKRIKLKLVGHSTTAQLKQEIQRLVREIVMIRDGGCILRIITPPTIALIVVRIYLYIVKLLDMKAFHVWIIKRKNSAGINRVPGLNYGKLRRRMAGMDHDTFRRRF